MGKGKQATTRQVEFTVVRFTSGYNAILGRTTLHAFQAVSSTYHQCLKFPSEDGVCCVNGSQHVAQLYYITSTYCGEKASMTKKKWAVEVMHNSIPRYILKNEEKVEPASQMEEITLRGKVQNQNWSLSH